METLLRVENLKTYFFTINGVLKAVDNLSFTINKEESFGLIGESGCGKSTTALSLIRMLSDTARIVEGKILLKNKDIIGLGKSELRKIYGKEIFMIFQNPMSSLNPVIKIKNQLYEIIKKKEGTTLKSNELLERALRILKQVDIPDPGRALNQFTHQLSGGMNQRVMIGMGIYLNPSLLILDEPTTALDSTAQFKIVELIWTLKKKHKMSQLIITHDFGIASKLCDRLGVMYAGKIIEQGKYLTLLKEAAHPYTKGLFNCIIETGRKADYLETIPGSLPSLNRLTEGCHFEKRCKIAARVCREVEPELVNLGDDHFVACHSLIR